MKPFIPSRGKPGTSKQEKLDIGYKNIHAFLDRAMNKHKEVKFSLFEKAQKLFSDALDAEIKKHISPPKEKKYIHRTGAAGFYKSTGKPVPFKRKGAF